MECVLIVLSNPLAKMAGGIISQLFGPMGFCMALFVGFCIGFGCGKFWGQF